MGWKDFFKKSGEIKENTQEEREKDLFPDSDKKPEEMFSGDIKWFKRLLAHNVRMPLAVIVGYGELLKEEGFTSRAEEMEYVRKICKNIDYLDTLFKVLLDADTEKLLTEKEHFDVLACIREVAEYVRMIAQKAGIRILVNSSREKVLLFGNRISLMRAFFNLIENSVRYMEQQGNIIITVEETEKEILIVYRDEGKGMAGDAEHIAEIGFQGPNGKADGCGLGMYLVRQTLEQQGGTFRVKTGEGKGMRVDMSFARK